MSNQFVFLAIILFTGYQSVAQILFPSDAVINVLDYRGEITEEDFTSGTVDVSDAINLAIASNNTAKLEGSGSLFESYTLYFPPGTYLVTKPLENDAFKVDGVGGTGKTIIFQGAGKDHTLIKLADNSPLFQDKEKPMPVLSNTEADTPTNSWTNIAFMSSIFDLTVDVGTGNPGAIGIRFIANNQGSVRNVKVIGSGYAGIDLDRVNISGPSLIKQVDIDGFDYGVRASGLNYATVLEDVRINNVTTGIYNRDHILTVRKITVSNASDIAIVNDHADAFLTLLDSDLRGTGNEAIYNKGYLFARNISSSGYTSILNDVKNEKQVVGYLDEYVADEIISHAEDAPMKSLGLEVLETPEVYWPQSLDDWVSVMDFGYSLGNEDAGPAIQAAIDFMNQPGNENKNTLYFPIGEYLIKTPVTIYGNVKKVFGGFSSISTKQAKSDDPASLFVVQDTDYPEIHIERLNLRPEPWKKRFAVIENRSSKTVVLRHNYVGHGKAYKNNGATGVLFIEDMCALSQVYYVVFQEPKEPFEEAMPQFEFGNQTVYARQLNPEQLHTHVGVDGGKLWILGIKTEEPGTVIHAKGGAQVELLGGCILPSFTDIGEHMFRIENSDMSIVVTEHISWPKYDTKSYYKNIILEERGEIILQSDLNSFPTRNTWGRAIPLFVGYGGRVEPIRAISVSTDTIQFDSLPIDQEATKQFQVMNTGNTNIEIDNILLPEGYSVNWTTATIKVDSSKTLDVAFDPSEVRSYNGDLVIKSSATSGSDTVALVGEGIDVRTRVLEVDGPIDFGHVPVGTSVDQIVTFSNIGNDALLVSAIILADGFSVSSDSFNLDPGEDIEVAVTFSPTETRDYSSTLRVKSNLTAGINSIGITAFGQRVLDIDRKDDIVLFPNPNSGTFILKSLPFNYATKVLSVTGEEVPFTYEQDGDQAKVTILKGSGIYFIWLYAHDEYEIHKIIVR